MRRVLQLLICVSVAALGLIQPQPTRADQGGRPAKLQAERPSDPAGNVRSGTPQAGPEFFVVCDQPIPPQAWTMPAGGGTTILHTCQFNVAGAALAYVLVTGSFGLTANAIASQYEANVEILLDNTAIDSMNRWVNVYSQPLSNNGLDGSFASSALLSLAPGVHTIAVRASYRGGGPLLLTSGHFGLLAFSSTSASLQACGSSADLGVWFGQNNPAFTSVRSCTVTAPANGTVLIAGDASVLGDAPNEQLTLRVGIDSLAGVDTGERVVIVTGAEPNDPSGNDMDANAAVMASLPISAGAHTIYLLGRGTGNPPITRSTLTALVIPQGSQVQSCANSSNPLTGLDANYKAIITCSLTASGPKRALIAGNLNPRYVSGSAPGEIRSYLTINGRLPVASVRFADIAHNYSAGAWRDAKVQVSSTGVGLPAGPVSIQLMAANISAPASSADAYQSSLFALIFPDLYTNHAFIPVVIR
jgi:hypothetical protein